MCVQLSKQKKNIETILWYVHDSGKVSFDGAMTLKDRLKLAIKMLRLAIFAGWGKL